MKKIFKIIGTLMTIVFLGSISLTSCTSIKSDNYIKNPKEHQVAIEQGGVQLWTNNCVRCHNIPPPNAYSDNEWEAIVNHMQKVAGFTVSDADKIAEFLKASN